jgi:hypothetical protein
MDQEACSGDADHHKHRGFDGLDRAASEQTAGTIQLYSDPRQNAAGAPAPGLRPVDRLARNGEAASVREDRPNSRGTSSVPALRGSLAIRG